MMSRPLFTSRRRTAVVLTVTAAVVAFGSWALWPVQDSACVVYSGSYVPANASQAEIDAAVRESYDKAVAAGACGPKRPRFSSW
ncbi:hypothetical protein R6G00_32160 [Streptomyces roseofulvus]|uniref:Uncharacterized protein n=3 Tax=Streptomyces TaxID=1883 RepID=A0ABU4KGD0_9ACTN|nr:hypothetical protein [Streptomyces roseolus]